VKTCFRQVSFSRLAVSLPLLLVGSATGQPTTEYDCLHNDPWTEQALFGHGPYSRGLSYNGTLVPAPNRFHRPVVSVDTARVVYHPDKTCTATFEVADAATHKPLLDKDGKRETVTLGIRFVRMPAIVQDPDNHEVKASPDAQFFMFYEIQEDS
jgi:hypothetical protein